MSLQKREVAKDDRAQEGSITLDRKTRKRSRVIALYGEVYRCHMQQNKEDAAARIERAGAFFHSLFTGNSSNALVIPFASAI